jgi:hypothetical protein
LSATSEPRHIPGTRLYRVGFGFLREMREEVEDLAAAIRSGLACSPPADRIASVGLTANTGRLDVELEVRSSELDDNWDAGTLNLLQLTGDRAATYWTRPAATLIEASITGTDRVLEALPQPGAMPDVNVIILRTTPLGDEVLSPVKTALAIRPCSSPCIHVLGVPADHGDRLAGELRDELDSHRWGPAFDLPPSIAYEKASRRLIATYPREPERRAALPLRDALNDLAAALMHFQAVLDQTGAIGGAAIEARLDTDSGRTTSRRRHFAQVALRRTANGGTAV